MLVEFETGFRFRYLDIGLKKLENLSISPKKYRINFQLLFDPCPNPKL